MKKHFPAMAKPKTKGMLNMKKHTIDIEGLREYEMRQEIAGSYGDGKDKALHVSVKNGCVTYNVLDHDVIVGRYQDIVLAAKAYNEI